MEKALEQWGKLWEEFYNKFTSLTTIHRIAIAILFTVLTALSAQIYLPLPFTPVPITGQVFTVLLCGILLGKNIGALSQIMYFTGGAIGINWFSATSAGIIRPTTGYIVGFILAAYIVGLITEKNRTRISIIYGMLASIAVLHLCGILWLICLLRISFYKAFLIGTAPFIPFDIIKAYFAGIIGNFMLKRKSR